MNNELLVFAGSSNPALADEICTQLGVERSGLGLSRFSNDNLSVQIMANVRERDVFVVQAFTEPASDRIMELLVTLDALRSASAKRITAVIPYYSYARSDKKDAPRISIAGRLIADLLKTAGADRVLTMDLHAEQVHGFFSMPVDHLTAIPIVAAHVAETCDMANSVVVATDAGGAKRAGKFASQLELPLAIIDKRRISDTEVRQGSVVGDVDGKDCIVFEDEISTGGTLVETARTLKSAGAGRVIAGATHGVLVGESVERLEAAPIESLIVTNTVHVPDAKRIDKLTVLSIASLMAQAIRRIHTGESVGELFSPR
ncbi:MAG: ribose-phosphate pyrophosphokinase [Gammaproteobacteria bacterium]|nr:ribose-phosphate pyrophosphokinase [Gammaproteobacteria bacterium]MBS04065.1 ribose-phosphate pyrophosphokinase [Gammaproteobacteria bacterium]|tara:strand:- start:201 stop:1148 length:948 start_codon:yes stop_codon:yes gene_type:complete